VVDVTDADALSRAIGDELAPAHPDPHARADLIVAAAWGTTGPNRARFARWSVARSTGTSAAEGAASLRVAAHLPGAVGRLPRPAFLAVQPAHLDRAHYVGEVVAEQLVHPLAQLVGLPLGQSYLHASAIERGDRRVAIVAGGAMGKTGSLLRLVDDGWSYLSDDLTVLDDDGAIACSAASVSVFPHNLERVPGGEPGFLAGRPPVDRLLWRAHRRLGRKGVRRKVAPADLFGMARVGVGGGLGEVVAVERADVDRLTTSAATAAEVARVASAHVERELAGGMEVLARGADDQPWLAEGLAAWREQTGAVLERAVAHAERRLVQVPRTMPEPEIEDELVRSLR
jgi:hypothetical protein